MTFMEAYLHNGNWRTDSTLTLINSNTSTMIETGDATILVDKYARVKVLSFKDNTVYLKCSESCKIKRKFYEKVKEYGSVDTRKYRYVLRAYGDVSRLPLEYLDTTEVYRAWEFIKIPVEWK